MSLWKARLAREVEHQTRIETAFDRADLFALRGDFARALESLSEAENLAGGLPDEYLSQREWWISRLAPLPA
jgi:hypothetical protein